MHMALQIIILALLLVSHMINPLTPGTFCKKCVFCCLVPRPNITSPKSIDREGLGESHTATKQHFLDILVIFRLVLSLVTFEPIQNAFATQQVAFLATSIAF